MQINKRFWHYWNGDMVKLTLKPNQTINLYAYQHTEEGYEEEQEEITHCAHTGNLIMERVREGRDCDGVLRHHNKLIAEEFYKDRDGFTVPAWDSKSSSQYDQFAQMAGY